MRCSKAADFEGSLHESNFIDEHQPRVPRRLYPADAVAKFLAAGGGEAARKKMLRAIRAADKPSKERKQAAVAAGVMA
jgi:hypothetical protein